MGFAWGAPQIARQYRQHRETAGLTLCTRKGVSRCSFSVSHAKLGESLFEMNAHSERKRVYTREYQVYNVTGVRVCMCVHKTQPHRDTHTHTHIEEKYIYFCGKYVNVMFLLNENDHNRISLRRDFRHDSRAQKTRRTRHKNWRTHTKTIL